MNEHIALILVAVIGLAGAIGSNLVNIFASRGKNEIDIILEGSEIIVTLQGQVAEMITRLDKERAMRYALEDTVKALEEKIRAGEIAHELEIKQIVSDYESKIEKLKDLLNQYARRIQELEANGKRGEQ